MNKLISIVLCTYNEVNNVEQTISMVSNFLQDVEIIIIDDNSKDGTIEKLNSLKSKYKFKLFVRKNERGLASAVKKGFEAASGSYVGFIDANSSDQILYFKDLILSLDNGNDISVLSRYVPGGGDERVFLRTSTSRLINIFCRIFLRIPFRDFTSGIFLMRKKILDEVTISSKGHGEYFIEFIYCIYKKKYRIIEIPYIQKKDKNLSESKSNPNIIYFFYLGFIYFFRIVSTILKN